MAIKYDDRNLGRDTKIKVNDAYLGNLYSIGDTKSSRQVIDITPYGADYKAYTTGTCDAGTLELELSESALKTSPLHDAYQSSTPVDLRIEFPSGAYMQCTALVSAYGTSVKKDDVVRTNVTIQLTGTPKFGDDVQVTAPRSLDRGSGVQLVANTPVVWKIITETTDPTTTISPDGYLIYGHSEAAAELVIEARSPSGDSRLHTITATREPMRVIPERLDMSPGESHEFATTQPVAVWAVEGDAHHDDTTIVGNTLQIAAAETAKGVWVRCDSVYGESAYAFVRIITTTSDG